MSFYVGFFFFLINCVGVLGLHGGHGGDERERETKIRERHKYILLYKYIILMYCIRIKNWDAESIVKWYGIIDKVVFWYDKIEFFVNSGCECYY